MPGNSTTEMALPTILTRNVAVWRVGLNDYTLRADENFTMQRPVCRAAAFPQALRVFSRSLTAASYASKHAKPRGEPIPEDLAALSPGVQTLAARLQLSDLPKATLARTLISDTASLKYTNNAGLARFGATVLNFYVSEYFINKYPRIPPAVLRHLVDTYTGVSQLARVGKQWGVTPDSRTQVQRYLAELTDDKVLGLLSFTKRQETVEKGIQEVNDEGISEDTALGVFVRALVAAVYSHRGLEGTRKFIYDAIIRPRSVDVRQLMAFSRPTRELAILCEREGLEPPVSRLMAETGRYSSAPVFVVGVFSGDQKLGEGQGSSLREARTRAAVNALQGWYLYSPVGQQQYVDHGEVVI